MSVIGHWRRSALGAGGVALLLPLGLTLGVALTTALGGGTTLRALGQVFAGPSTPQRFNDPRLDSPGDVPAIPLRPRPVAARAGGAVASSPAGRSPAANRPGRTPAKPKPATPAKPKPASPATPPAATTTPTGAAPPPPADQPSGSAVHQAAQGAADTVAGVPVVGGATDDAMQTVVDLIP